MMSQTEPEEMSFERERAILEEIQNNPNLHHNALIKSIVPKYMAKTTFERTKNRLIEKNVLSVSQIGNKKFYSITENYQKNSLQLIERVSHENYQTLQHEIKRAKEDFHHKDVTEKICLSVHLLRELLQTDNCFTILEATKNPKKTLYKDEHLEIQEMISKIFEVITKDKDFELVYSAVMSCLENNITKKI
jgi:hypothetical protein